MANFTSGMRGADENRSHENPYACPALAGGACSDFLDSGTFQKRSRTSLLLKQGNSCEFQKFRSAVNCGASTVQSDVLQNEWFSEKLSEEKYVVTTRHGGFAYLDEEEYTLLYGGRFGKHKALFEKLESAGIVITKENTEKILKSNESQFLFLFAPKAYIINLSNSCNLNCTYCHARANATGGLKNNARPMDKKTMDDTIEFLLSAPGRELYLEFQGGEPLAEFGLVKEFIEKITDGAKARGKKILSTVIVTNMTIMNAEIAKYLIENGLGLCSSLDGPEELHDLHRKYPNGKGSYKTAVRWISYFRERSKAINLLPTITPNSLKFGAKSIIDEYIKHGCRRVPLRAVFKIGRAKDNGMRLHIRPERFAEFWKEGIEHMAQLHEKGIMAYDPVIQAMIKNMLGFPRSYMCMRKPCGAGISQMSISPDGTIFPCDLAKSMPALSIGSVSESYFDVAARALPFVSRTCESQPLCDTCAFGAYCGTCMAKTYAAFSDTVSRTPRDFDCKVNRAMFRYLFEKMQHERYRKIFESWAVQKQ